MDSTCLQYCMTDEQRNIFDQEGYLIVEDALDAEFIQRLIEAGDRVDRRERQSQGLDADKLLSKFRTIVEDEVFLELLDWPAIVIMDNIFAHVVWRERLSVITAIGAVIGAGSILLVL